MNLLNASQIRFNGSDITLIKLDGTIVYEVKNEEPGNTNPFYVEYTVDNKSVQALNTSNNGYCYGLPKLFITRPGIGTISEISQGSSREITLKDGTITTDASTTCDKIAKVRLWYPEEIHALKFTGVYTNPPIIKTLEYCNTSNFTDMSQMFEECSKITELDLSSFDTSKVTDMSMMFKYCTALASLDVSSWDTSNVTNMSYMFYCCAALASLDLSSWDTSNVTDMTNMFYYCQLLTSLNVSNFDTSNVTDMKNMFLSCNSLTSLDLSNFNTSNVTTMKNMFYECKSLTSLDLSNFNTSNVTDITNMFSGCTALTTITCNNAATINKIASKLPTRTADAPGTIITDCPKSDLDITTLSSKGWNVESSAVEEEVLSYYIEYTVDNTKAYALNGGSSSYSYGLPAIYSSSTSYSFTGYEDIEITLLDGTITTDVTTTCDNIAKVKIWYPVDTVAVKFYGSSAYKPLVKTVNYCKTDNFTDMSNMFCYCQSLVSVNSSDWNTSNVTSMYRMFYYCGSKLKTLDVTNWDTSKVTNMNSMFYYCPYMGKIDVSKWDTSNVTNMGSMFAYCYYIELVAGLSNWNTSNVTSMTQMFYECRYIRSLHLSNWNTSNVVNMSSMFYNCNGLYGLNISNFDTSKVTSISSMFGSCTSLRELRLNNCSNDTISDIISSSSFPTDAISGRTIYCTEDAASGLTAPTNWVFSFIGEEQEPEENTSPYYIEYTVDNSCPYQLDDNCNSKYYGLPREYASGNNGAIMSTSSIGNPIEITLLDGTITTDTTVLCNQVAKVKLWYSEENIGLSFEGDSSNSPVVKTVNYLNTSNFTRMANMFAYCANLTSVNASNWDTSNVYTMYQMFYYCKNLISLDLSNCDASKVIDMDYMFYGCKSLTDFIAPKNISVAVSFSTCTQLTHDSLMSIINNLATVTTTQTLTLGSTNLAKLSSAEKAIATNKGWTLA